MPSHRRASRSSCGYALSAVILEPSNLTRSDRLACGEQCRSYTRFAMLNTLSKPAFWRQNRAGDFTNELIATAETVYLRYDPGILDIADQRHGAHLLKYSPAQIDDLPDAGEAQSGKSGITLVLEENGQRYNCRYWPVAVCGRDSTFTDGRLAELHPPPRALIRETLAVMRRRRISTAARSSARAVLCAVVTSR